MFQGIAIDIIGTQKWKGGIPNFKKIDKIIRINQRLFFKKNILFIIIIKIIINDEIIWIIKYIKIIFFDFILILVRQIKKKLIISIINQIIIKSLVKIENREKV